MAPRPLGQVLAVVYRRFMLARLVFMYLIEGLCPIRGHTEPPSVTENWPCESAFLKIKRRMTGTNEAARITLTALPYHFLG